MGGSGGGGWVRDGRFFSIGPPVEEGLVEEWWKDGVCLLHGPHVDEVVLEIVVVGSGGSGGGWMVVVVVGGCETVDSSPMALMSTRAY